MRKVRHRHGERAAGPRPLQHLRDVLRRAGLRQADNETAAVIHLRLIGGHNGTGRERDGDAGQNLKQIFPIGAGVVRGPARGDYDIAYLPAGGRNRPDRRGVFLHTGSQHGRLLKYFSVHVHFRHSSYDWT